MYRDLEGQDPAVEKIDGKPYLRVSTGRSRYATLEVRGTEQFLFLENAGFVIAVNETLPYWRETRFPAAYRPMHEITGAVTIESRSQKMGILAETVELRLNAACIITMDHSKQIVSIPVEDFVIQAISRLAEKPILDTSNLMPSFVERLGRRWGGVSPEKKISSAIRAAA